MLLTASSHTPKAKVLFLTDYFEPDDLEGWFLAEACRERYCIEVRGFRRRVTGSMRWRRVLAYWEYLRLAAYALTRRKDFDCMIFWAATNGILVAFLARLFRLDVPKIILWNLIVGEKHGVRRIVDLIVQMSLPNVTAISVSSRELISIYSKRFRFHGRTYFIPDAIYTFNSRRGEQGEYVFAGGASFRDWPTLIKAARRIPEEPFMIFTSGLEVKLKRTQLPANIVVRYDVTQNKFYQMLSGAKFVIIPLLHEDVPSGQLVLLNAMDYGKAIIATRTTGTKEYIEDGVTGILVNPQDVDDLVSKLRLLAGSPELVKQLGENAKEAVKQYDVTHFARQFLLMLDEVVGEE